MKREPPKRLFFEEREGSQKSGYGKESEFQIDSGLILKENSQIFDLIQNNLDNNDYLMIKGSNSTGLNRLVSTIKKGNINAL